MVSRIVCFYERERGTNTPNACVTILRGNRNGMCLIAGVVDGNFDATAGLVFKGASESVQYSFEKRVQGEEAEKGLPRFVFVAGDRGRWRSLLSLKG